MKDEEAQNENKEGENKLKEAGNKAGVSFQSLISACRGSPNFELGFNSQNNTPTDVVSNRQSSKLL